MKTSIKIQVLLAFCCLVFIGCSSVPKDNEQTTYEDAVRIKPEYSAQYFQKAQNAANRDGRTLRGYVSHIQIMRDSAQNSIDTVFAFQDKIDTTLSSKGILIPLKHMESIPDLFPGIQTDSLGGFNLVESFHVTKQIPLIRKIPLQTVKPCNCDPLDLSFGLNFRLGLGIDAGLNLHCFDREYSPVFLGVLGNASMFNDGNALVDQGKIHVIGDVIAGARLGKDQRWMLGFTYSSGIQTVNAGAITSLLTNLDTLITIPRPMVLLTGRYYFNPPKNVIEKKANQSFFYINVNNGESEGSSKAEQELNEMKSSDNWFKAIFGCIKPYTYGEFGMSFDAQTKNAWQMSAGATCNTCVAKIKEAQANGEIDLDWSLPLSYGMGIGLDIPILPFIDIELDLGYRSIAVGDSFSLLGFADIPGTRRIGTFQLRLGVIY